MKKSEGGEKRVPCAQWNSTGGCQIKWHLGIKYYFHFISVQKNTIKTLSTILYSPSRVEDVTLANTIRLAACSFPLLLKNTLQKDNEPEHAVHLCALKVLLKWANQLHWLLRNLEGVWSPGRQAVLSPHWAHNSSGRISQAHLIGGKHQRSAEGVRMSPLHTFTRVTFYWGGWETTVSAPNCWKHRQNPCGSVQGLERAPRSLSAAPHAASF